MSSQRISDPPQPYVWKLQSGNSSSSDYSFFFFGSVPKIPQSSDPEGRRWIWIWAWNPKNHRDQPKISSTRKQKRKIEKKKKKKWKLFCCFEKSKEEKNEIEWILWGNLRELCKNQRDNKKGVKLLFSPKIKNRVVGKERRVFGLLCMGGLAIVIPSVRKWRTFLW